MIRWAPRTNSGASQPITEHSISTLSSPRYGGCSYLGHALSVLLLNVSDVSAKLHGIRCRVYYSF
jgi:hypothetical protein